MRGLAIRLQSIAYAIVTVKTGAGEDEMLQKNKYAQHLKQKFDISLKEH